MSAPALGRPRAIAAAALVGFACKAAELTAVRIQAPHFGDSAYVWTNVIGVILAALALGAYLGGRLAGRTDAAQWLVRLLGAAGVLVVAAALLAGARVPRRHDAALCATHAAARRLFADARLPPVRQR